jgi:hypothetical protein
MPHNFNVSFKSNAIRVSIASALIERTVHFLIHFYATANTIIHFVGQPSNLQKIKGNQGKYPMHVGFKV